MTRFLRRLVPGCGGGAAMAAATMACARTTDAAPAPARGPIGMEAAEEARATLGADAERAEDESSEKLS